MTGSPSASTKVKMMKKRLVILFCIGCAFCAFAGGGYQHLMRPMFGEPTLMRLTAKSGMSARTLMTGFIQSTNVTAFTAILWARLGHNPFSYSFNLFAEADFTTDPARATREGGAELEDLLGNAFMVAPVPLSAGGTWQAACLPNSYDCPATLADKWGYGCFCFNLTTDTPLTLTVGGAELQIPATNCMIRNIQAVSADRTVTIAASSPDACINFGIAVNPLVQFYYAGQFDGQQDGNVGRLDPQFGGIVADEWRMVAVRGKIEDGVVYARTDGYSESALMKSMTGLTRTMAHPRTTFAQDSRIRLSCCFFQGGFVNPATGQETEIRLFGGKVLNGWLTDAEIERIRDLDAAELHRRGED